MLRVFQSFLRIHKLAAIGKGIWRDIEHSHDQCAFAQFEGTRAQIPLEDRTHARTILNEFKVFRGSTGRGDVWTRETCVFTYLRRAAALRRLCEVTAPGPVPVGGLRI